MIRPLLTILLFFISLFGSAQKIKVEWASGDVTVYKKGTTTTTKVKKNEIIDLTDRLFLGDKSLLVVSDYSNKLFEVKKKGYITGKELSEGLLKVTDNEYQRYMAFILKEVRSHEGDMKSTEKGIPGAPSRGSDFLLTLPDTLRIFDYQQLPVKWTNSTNTESVNIKLLTDKKNVLLDLDLNGNVFWFNNINTYFLIKKSLTLLIYERSTDGQKILKTSTVIKQSTLDEAKIKKQFDEEFKDIQDERFNKIAKAIKWELNQHQLTALDIYKILLLDYPDDELVKTSLVAFTARTGLQ